MQKMPNGHDRLEESGEAEQFLSLGPPRFPRWCQSRGPSSRRLLHPHLPLWPCPLRRFGRIARCGSPSYAPPLGRSAPPGGGGRGTIPVGKEGGGGGGEEVTTSRQRWKWLEGGQSVHDALHHSEVFIKT